VEADDLRSLGISEFLELAVLGTGIIHIFAGLKNSFDILTLAGAGFLGGLLIFRYADRLHDKLAYMPSPPKTRLGVTALSLPYTGSQFYFYYQFYGLNLGPLQVADKILQLGVLVAGSILIVRKYRQISEEQ
jgi:hypothetical protein